MRQSPKRADYLLCYCDIALAVVEAKAVDYSVTEVQKFYPLLLYLDGNHPRLLISIP